MLNLGFLQDIRIEIPVKSEIQIWIAGKAKSKDPNLETSA